MTRIGAAPDDQATKQSPAAFSGFPPDKRDATAEGPAKNADGASKKGGTLTRDGAAGGKLVRGESRREDSEREAIETDDVGARLLALEKKLRRMKIALAVVVLALGYVAFDVLVPNDILVQQKLVESKSLKLVDSAGHPRLFVRLYSRVPVLQLMDKTGRPRMSMGLRFDDSPFLELSDKEGRTRAMLEITQDDTAALTLLNASGESSFQIKQ